MNQSALDTLADSLRGNPSLVGKRDIDLACAQLGLTTASVGRPGDDAAALPDGDGWQLLATEGFLNGFVETDPWFAGWCGIMVNISDIAAMGGRPVAVTNALWAPSESLARPILDGMKAASAAYGVPIVGGHTNLRTDRCQLAVSIYGRARALITSFDATPGDVLIAATDLRGAWRAPFDNWQAALDAPPARLRGDLEILPALAEDGLTRAGKDISQGGIVGTALMLAECSAVGVTLDLDAVIPPTGVALQRWLTTFPSFGFLLCATPENAPAICARFRARDIHAAPIGRITDGSDLVLSSGGASATLWDHARTPYLNLRRKESADA